MSVGVILGVGVKVGVIVAVIDGVRVIVGVIVGVGVCEGGGGGIPGSEFFLHFVKNQVHQFLIFLDRMRAYI